MIRLAALSPIVAIIALAPAQQFVAELDPASATNVSAEAQYAVAGVGHVWFGARSADAGFELWRSDGTAAGTRMAMTSRRVPTTRGRHR